MSSGDHGIARTGPDSLFARSDEYRFAMAPAESSTFRRFHRQDFCYCNLFVAAMRGARYSIDHGAALICACREQLAERMRETDHSIPAITAVGFLSSYTFPDGWVPILSN
ncbi:hypothetical protein ATO67_21865 [Agrobacterium bohemicum]|uniref:Uncharacterized protein n=1 Tax=Agrobacterium bohemicum TaxID=2052828 RepID=A0A135P6A1_9HYPH|nr:hypothetical protein ATO67_21865 [Agrobacterium bohemicum]